MSDDLPLADADERFNQLMAGTDHPMVIVTTVSGGVRAGCLVGFHAQAGIAPPEYGVWLSKANHTYRVGALADLFAVHFPRRRQRRLAELFGGTTGDDIDKFDRCRWTEGPGSVPLLDDCPHRFAGRRVAWLDPGTDHVCVVLRPLTAEVEPGRTMGDALSFADVEDLEAGHEAGERQRSPGGPADAG